MDKIKAGIIIKNKFIQPKDQKETDTFYQYIDYITRKAAIHKDNDISYDLYQNYMENPLKSTGLFTGEKMELNEEERNLIKQAFDIAKKNESIMWQTVISFDNRWLEQNGIYNTFTNSLDENKIKEASILGINKMMKNEKLENAIWCAAIHRNTDNVHVHVATVEPIPMREKKEIKGELVTRGKFKQKSLSLCKSSIANIILNEREQNKQINEILRGSIISQKENHLLSQDKELSNQFLELYRNMPKTNKNMWNYKSNVMSKLIPDINKLSTLYLEKYHRETFENYKNLLLTQQAKYNIAYGDTDRSYYDSKMQDLYYRLGNSILKEIKIFSKHDVIIPSNEEKEKIFFEQDGISDQELTMGEEYSLPDNEVPGSIDFKSKNYKMAKKYLYRKIDGILKPDYQKAYELFMEDALKGNVLSIYELASMYKYGRGIEIDNKRADTYYKRAFQGFEKIADNDSSKMKGYAAYRVGKMYEMGMGTERDYQNAITYYEKSDNPFAHYALGNIFFKGKGVDIDFNRAFQEYNKSVEDVENAYAFYQLGYLYEKGLGTEVNQEKSKSEYEKAFYTFINLDNKNPDDNIKYRIACMLEKGIGTEQNMELSEMYLEDSAQLGNEFAKYKLSQYYLVSQYPEKIQQAFTWLSEAAENKHTMAQYALGKLYMQKEYENLEKAKSYLTMAAKQKHEYAQYSLGKLYLDQENKDLKNAEYWLTMAAEQNNQYAEYSLGKLYLSKEMKNIDLAEKWLLAAASQEHSLAQYSIGKLYLTDDKKDIKKAVYWLEKAAEKDNSFAEFILGKMYTEGKDVPQDIKKGMEYLKRSAEHGNKYAEKQLSIKEKYKRASERARINYELEKAMRRLKNTLNDDWEHISNVREHEKMIEEKLREEERNQ